MVDQDRKRVRKSPEMQDSTFSGGRIPPQAVDLEEALLGSILSFKDSYLTIGDIIRPEMFYKDCHQTIYTAIQNLSQKYEPIDILTVTDQLRTMGELENIGGPFYISQLTNRITSSSNIESYARIIIQKYMMREIIATGQEMINAGFDESADEFETLEKAENALMNVGNITSRGDFRKLGKIIPSVITDMEAACKNDGSLRGIASGFYKLDQITNGWQKTDLIIMAGRPGMGKTALAVCALRNAGIDYNKPSAIFSLEMSAEQLATRMLSGETSIEHERMRSGKLATAEWETLNCRMNKLINAPIFIDDTPAITVHELRSKARRLRMRYNIELIVIDYLQLMTTGVKEYKGNREGEISYISRNIKALAKELKIPIIALSQLSRSVEIRGGSKRPLLSDLRESGAIEQDADVVMFVYRPEYYGYHEWDDGLPTFGEAEIIISKHRNGSCGDVRLKFIPSFVRFENMDGSLFVRDLEPNFNFEREKKEPF